MSTDIELVTTALADFDKVAAGLAILEKSYAGVVYDVQTTGGMEAAKAARLAIRTPRYEIERIRKSAKAPLIAIGKKLDGEASRITTELMRLEDPIDRQIKHEEGRKERERQAKIAAEAARVAAIQARIENIRSAPVRYAGKPSDEIAAALADAEQRTVIDETYQEFADAARQALAVTVAALKGLHATQVAQEAEAARIKAERAELAKLRAEQEARAAEERRREDEARRAREAAEAEAAAKARAEIEAERARLAEERRAREAAEAEAAAKARAEIEAERARLAEERRQHEAVARGEADRIAAERAELARQQEAAKPKPAPVKRPSDAELASAVAFAFSVDDDTADTWLSEYRTERKAA